MRKLIFIFLIFCTIGAYCQEIVKIEYSIDKFVAEGNGTSVEVSSNTTSLETVLDINISELDEGQHTIYFRSLNADGKWSFPAKSSFYIKNNVSEHSQDIVKMEYSIDKFVAEGNGTIVSASSATTVLDSIIDIAIADLDEGQHTIYFRSQNAEGKWCLPTQKSFYISRPDIVAVEKIFYQVSNETYTSEWHESLVVPTMKNVDSLIAVSTNGLDTDQHYNIEFYAVNTNGVRGFSAYLNNISLISNSSPEALTSSLTIEMFTNEAIQLSMDSLFADSDIGYGDSLTYTVNTVSDNALLDFSNWSSDHIIEFSPDTSNVNTYSFVITSTDLSGETASIDVSLAVKMENHSPEALVSTLTIEMLTNEVVQVSMDSLFADSDIEIGDSLTFNVNTVNDNTLLEFMTWTSENILEFSPDTSDVNTYSFVITSTDLSGETASIDISLTVKMENRSPEALVSTLNIEMYTDGVVVVSMDSLFADSDMVYDDSLAFDLANISNNQLLDFASWTSPNVIEFAPTSDNVQTYTFNIVATDLADETASIATILIVNKTLGIENNFLANLNFFPNPATDVLYFQNLRDIENIEVQISNLQGVIISEQKIKDSKIDVSNLNTGVYFLKASLDDNTLIRKFIVR